MPQTRTQNTNPTTILTSPCPSPCPPPGWGKTTTTRCFVNVDVKTSAHGKRKYALKSGQNSVVFSHSLDS